MAGEEFLYIGAALLFLKGQRRISGRIPSKLILATVENHVGESDLLAQVCNPSFWGAEAREQTLKACLHYRASLMPD